ncbi:AraC family transcriptional regulator [Stratiformator vulcanicus]|uniref:Bifunctional transcriptional activator/DNA repair enzyme AdaA n=1 Tax=Stratiformator vulcanicus TaxID=2527980 RepID=A0A517QVS0_9PLAN|nr:AraC family transcriptional regulator [Stratiformator vulcanicus]QDT35710.1 Bifunctional transcriptional activator/DNA repair enzyme AdaA [Stratiformator vulcanicus]
MQIAVDPVEQISAELSVALQLAELFDQLHDTVFFAKDREGRFIHVNLAFLTMRGLSDHSEVVGKTDLDLHPRYLAEQYIEEDRQIMASGKPLPNQTWLVPDSRGDLKWYLSCKTPLLNSAGEVIGIAGKMRDVQKFYTQSQPYGAMDGVLQYVLTHYPERIEVPQLAKQVHLSVSQFGRRFQELYSITPQQYILRVRINAATQALTATDLTIGEIAQNCGFFDQSHFTKQFKRETGTTPLTFRRKYREDG